MSQILEILSGDEHDSSLTAKCQEFSEDYSYTSLHVSLLASTIQKNWKNVVDIYSNDPTSHQMKLTDSGETALHMSISSYSPKWNRCRERIKRMIECIELHPPEKAKRILSMENISGDTPLHVAAGVGLEDICELLAKRNPELICCRNSLGETPLFVAAQQGKLQTVLCLFKYLDKGNQCSETLRRKKDGNTILHAAVSGEYLELAYQIIRYYPKLSSSVNAEGETALHILAEKPHLFKSSTRLGFFESIFYDSLPVAKLKEEEYNPRATENPKSSESNLQANDRTCADLFSLLWKICKGISVGKEDGKTDEENPEGPRIREVYEFTPSYTTFILVLQLINFFLGVLGFDNLKMTDIQKMKQQHSDASQIMREMVKTQTNEKHKFNGQRPINQKPTSVIPNDPPVVDNVHLAGYSTETSSGSTFRTKDINIEDGQYQNKTDSFGTPLLAAKTKTLSMVKEVIETWSIGIQDLDSNEKQVLMLAAESKQQEAFGTPLLLAAKNGISSTVKEIIKTCPVAIQDLDPNGKNVLMLAAENKHAKVFRYLLRLGLPDYMFHHIDKDGNNLLHLAAKLNELEPWRVHDAVLEMRWEIKWFKYMKRKVPLVCSIKKNKEGKKPDEVFTQTHTELVKEGKKWLIRTSDCCSVVAALIATVAFATSAAIPGGSDDQTGYPILKKQSAFGVFSVTSLVALSLSITSLIFFVAIMTSRFEERLFERILPAKLFVGLASLLASIATMLISFSAAHSFVLTENLRAAAVLIYMIAVIPVAFFALVQLPLHRSEINEKNKDKLKGKIKVVEIKE